MYKSNGISSIMLQIKFTDSPVVLKHAILHTATNYEDYASESQSNPNIRSHTVNMVYRKNSSAAQLLVHSFAYKHDDKYH